MITTYNVISVLLNMDLVYCTIICQIWYLDFNCPPAVSLYQHKFNHCLNDPSKLGKFTLFNLIVGKIQKSPCYQIDRFGFRAYFRELHTVRNACVIGEYWWRVGSYSGAPPLETNFQTRRNHVHPSRWFYNWIFKRFQILYDNKIA